MQVQFQFDQDALASNLFCFGRQGGASATAHEIKVTFEQANILCKFMLPPQSHPIRTANSYSLPSWSSVRYAKTISGALAPIAGPNAAANAPVKTELRYVTLQEAPNMMLFRVAPTPAHYPAGFLAHGSDSH